MKGLVLRFNYLFYIVIVLLMLIVLFIDTESLNSLFVSYNNDVVVNEINVLTVDNVEVVYTTNNNSNSSDTSTNNNSVATTVNKVNTNTNVSLVNKVASNDYWAWPTEKNYIITSPFGYRWGSNHDAIDISGPGYGSNVYAANNGVVTVVKGGCVPGNTYCNGRGGNYIIINHNSNNYYTIYMHLKDIRVSVGDVVSRGQVIGTMGNTGNVYPAPTASSPYLGTHLHFGLYIGQPYNGGYAVNPMRLY